MLTHRPLALTAVKARRIKIWGRSGTGAPSLAKIEVCDLSLPDSTCASAFDTRSLSLLLLLFALDVCMKGRSIFYQASGLKATERRSRQEHLLGHACRCKKVYFCTQTGGISSYHPSFGAFAHLAPFIRALRQLMIC